MLLLGLLFLGASGAFAGLLIADNRSGGPDYGVTLLGHHLATMNSLSIFVAGLALALVFCLGFAMMAAGGVRTRRRGPAVHGVRPTEEQADRTAVDRDVLADDDMADERAVTTTKPAVHRHRHRPHFGH